MDFSYLDPRAKQSWMIARSIFLLLLLLLNIIGYLIFWSAIDPAYRWILILCSGLTLIPQILFAYLLPLYQYRRHRYLIAEDRVEIIEGIIIRTHTVIPILRIQHVVVSAGPINQILRLADVAIHTASGIHQIPELNRDEAQRLCAMLKEQVNQRLRAALLSGSPVKPDDVSEKG